MIESNNATREFADVLAEIMTRQDKGETIDLKAVIDEYPKFETEFTEYFAAVESIDEMSEPDDEFFNNTMVFDETETVAGNIETKQNPTKQTSTRSFSTDEYPFMFGRYEMLRLLGKGGMGKVYLAKDSILGRKVALKIPEIPADNDEYVKRFYREARAAAAIQHRNICPVFDIGELDGIRFISMAYIEGKPLSDFTGKKKPQNPKAVAMTVRKMAIALHEAHKLGIVHRDLKPANVMIDKQNEPVIMDFGLARDVSLSDATQLTQAGVIVGTPAYMSPEQIRDTGNVTASSDVYSLGVIMYLMLTGKLPFEGDLVSIITQIIADAPSRPVEICGKIDPVMDEICLKAMSKVATDRFSSMIDFASALNDFLRGNSTQTESDDRKPKAIAKPSVAKTNATVVQPAIPDSTADPLVNISSSTQLRANSVLDAQGPASAMDVKIETEPNLPRPKTKSLSMPNNRTAWIAAAIAFGIVGILSVVFLLPTKDGYIRVEIDDPNISAVLNSNGVTITSTDKSEAIKIEPGTTQSLKITRGDFEFETEDFVLRRGEKSVLKINFVKGKLIATRDGSAIDVEQKNVPKMVLKPLGKDPTKKTITTPDASSNSEPLAPIGPQSTTREIAAWILSKKGKVLISSDQKDLQCTSPDELPKSEFNVLEVELNQSFQDEDLRHIARLKSLRKLKSSFGIKGPGYEYFAGSALMELHCNMNGKGTAKSFLSSIAKIESLQTLSISDTTLRGRLRQLSPLAKLKHFYTWSNYLEPEDVDDLAVLSQLESISWGGRLDDQSPKKFVDAFPKLQNLDIRKTDVTDSGAVEFAKSKSLLSLKLFSTKVTPAGAERLDKLMPNCNIEYKPRSYIRRPESELNAIKEIIEKGGTIIFRSGGNVIEVTDVSGIPEDPTYRVDEIRLADSTCSDADIAQLSAIKTLRVLSAVTASIKGSGVAAIAELPIEELYMDLTEADLDAVASMKLLNALQPGRLTKEQLRKLHPLASKIRRLSFYSEGMNDENLAELAAFNNVVELTLSGNPITDESVQQILKMPNLTRLFMTDTKITDEGAIQLAALRNLQYIEIESPRCTPDGIEKLRKLLPDCDVNIYVEGPVVDESKQAESFIKRLIEIDAHFFQSAGRRIQEPLAVDLQEFYHLLNLDKRFGDQDLKMAFGFFPNLHTLGLDHTDITYEGLKVFKDRPVEMVAVRLNFTGENAKHLLNFTKTKGLGIGSTPLNDESLKYIARLDHLETLYIPFTSTFGEGLKELAALPKLRNLELNGTAISSSDLEWIKESKTLEDLNLCQCKNIDNLSFVTNCKSLRYLAILGLDVELTPLESTGIKHLVLDYVPEKHEKVLRNMKSLEMVNHVPVSKFFSQKPASEAVRKFVDRLFEIDAQLIGMDGSPIKDPANLNRGNVKELFNLDKRFGDQDLKTAFEVFPNLKNARVEKSGITYEGLKEFRDKPVDHIDLGLDFGGEKATHLLNLNNATGLGLGETGVTDDSLQYIARLKNIRSLNIGRNPIRGHGLKELAAMPRLADITFEKLEIESKDLSWIKNSKTISHLNFYGCKQLTDISFVKGCKNLRLIILPGVDPALDLSPLEGTEIQYIELDYVPEKHEKHLRKMKSLEVINRVPVSDFFSKTVKSK